MRDEKPFAVKRYDAAAYDPGCTCCGPSVDFREEVDGDWVKVEDHNAAVAACERKAAAKALVEAADAEDELATLIERNIVLSAAHYRRYPGGKPGALQAAREKREAAQRLRTRAAALEGGA